MTNLLVGEIWKVKLYPVRGSEQDGIRPCLDENIPAHISIRLPLNLVRDLKKLALNEKYEGRYQVLIREILQAYTEKNKSKKKLAVENGAPC